MNLHLDAPNDSDTKQMNSILDAYGLTQHITEPTHRLGHTLDFLVTRTQNSLLGGVPTVTDPHLYNSIGQAACDHLGISFMLNAMKPPITKTYCEYRRYRSISIPAFTQDISLALTGIDMSLTADELAESYNSVISNAINKHAPIIKKMVKIRPNTPWYDDDLRAAKHERRRAERIWRRSKSEIHRQYFKEQVKAYNKLLLDTKKKYFNNKVNELQNDQNKLYRITHTLLGDSGETVLPEHTDSDKLASDFSKFFEDKIQAIRKKILDIQPKRLDVSPLNMDTAFTNVPLIVFPPTTDEIKRLVKKAANKTCRLDPMPTWLLKECLDTLLPIITCIVNKSITWTGQG